MAHAPKRACQRGKRGSSQEVKVNGASEITTPFFDSKQCEDIQRALGKWYREHRRDLPWRYAEKYPTVYETWVSEVMSQQTQLRTLIPYWQRWMQRFPSVTALANAREEEVLSAWSGLGYYRRAIYLHKGAKYIMEKYADKSSASTHASESTPSGSDNREDAWFPREAKVLQDIPGVGPYTAAAISSICFNEPVIAVDGNVVRVLSRLRCERDFDPKNSASIRKAREWGVELIRGCTTASDFNQGLIDIGASVCGPSGAPQCNACPLSTWCASKRALDGGELARIETIVPLVGSAPVKKDATVYCLVHRIAFERAGNSSKMDEREPLFVVIRRPSEGLLANMLEFPSIEADQSQRNASELSVPDCPTPATTTPATTTSARKKNTISPKEKIKKAADAHVGEVDGMSKEDILSKLACAESLKGSTDAVPWKVEVSDPHHVGAIRHIFSHVAMCVEVHIVHVKVLIEENAEDESTVLDAKIRAWYRECIASAIGVSIDRVFMMREGEIRSSSASRLMLKELECVLVPSNGVGAKKPTRAAQKRPRASK